MTGDVEALARLMSAGMDYDEALDHALGFLVAHDAKLRAHDRTAHDALQDLDAFTDAVAACDEALRKQAGTP